MSLPAVVMAAGLGTRLRPLTEAVAKPVLPVDGRPVVATLLRELAAAGAREATDVVGHLGDQVAAVVGDGSAYGLDVLVVRQPSPDGSADAVRVAGREHEAKSAIAIEEERVVRVVDRGGPGPWTGAPLWAVGAPVHERLCLDAAPYELGNAFQRAIDDGHAVAAVPIASTRDLTRPLDLLRENFPYLRTIT